MSFRRFQIFAAVMNGLIRFNELVSLDPVFNCPKGGMATVVDLHGVETLSNPYT